MKKVVLLILSLILICGCSNSDNTENSLVKNDYINQNSYNTIYNDLVIITNNVSYIPSKEVEKTFYEMIEVIRDNCNKFTSSEINDLYNLMNNNYKFKYSDKRYNNTKFANDLNKIKKCITE